MTHSLANAIRMLGAVACFALSAMTPVGSASAAPIVSQPDANGFRWCTVGSRGNVAFEGNGPFDPSAGRGGVGYDYRIAQTEVTVRQWLQFVRAYAPFAGDSSQSIAFTGTFIVSVPDPSMPGGFRYEAPVTAMDFPTTCSWRFAARYCNWLTNGQGHVQEAFEAGAYDSATFTMNSDGSFADQATRSASASYWIPSGDEWIKAVYYAPASSNDLGERYWSYPNGSDLALRSGLPESAGQTNAGLGTSDGSLSVGSYPGEMSPWGLLDASGGVREWNEDWGEGRTYRAARGSSVWDSPGIFESLDRISWVHAGGPNEATLYGFRVASFVPSPNCGAVIAVVLPILLQNRKR